MEHKAKIVSEQKHDEQEQEITVEVTKRPKVLTDVGESASQIVTVK